MRVEPVVRLSGNVNRAGGRTGIGIVGLDAEVIPALRGWRDDFSALSPASLASRVEPVGETEIRGPVLPDDATQLEVAARGELVSLTASVETRPAATSISISASPSETARRVAAARGAGRARRRSHAEPAGQGAGAEARADAELALEIGPLMAQTAAGQVVLDRYADWIGVNGIEAVRNDFGVRLTGTLTEQAATRFRPT